MRAERIHDARAVALWAVRSAGAFLIGWGVFMVSARALYALLGTGRFSSAWTVWEGIGQTHGVFRGLPLIAIGLALVLFGRALVRWVVAAPERGCPGCGYESRPGVCPECGYRPAAGEPGASDAA